MSGHIRRFFIIIFFIVVFAANAFSNKRHFTTYKMSSGLAHNTVRCLMQDNDGYIWMGTRDGLSRFDGKNFKLFKHVFGDSTSIVNNHVSCLMQSENNDIWVGTVGGLSKYNKQTKEFKSYNLAIDSLSISTNYVRSIFEINNQELLIGTTSGMYIFNRTTETYKYLLISADISSKANGIRTIFKESSGDILVGTNDGLFLFENNVFNKILLNANQDGDPIIVRTIKQDKNGVLWVGTERKGVLLLKYNQGDVEMISSLDTNNSDINSNSVRSVFFENDSLVWLGTFGGINIYNTKTKTISHHTSTSLNTGVISHNSVHDIKADSTGGVWVATYWGGVNYYNRKKNIITHYSWFFDNNQKNNSNIVSVVKEYDEELWMGTEGGGLLQSIDLGATINNRINKSNSNLPHNTIKSIEKGYNKLWVGTLSGLSCYDLETKELKNYFHDPNDKNSLLSGHITAIHHENEEKIFLGSNASGMQVFNSITNEFTTLTDFINTNITCFYQDSNNHLWVGTENSVMLYDLSKDEVIDISGILNEDIYTFNFVSFIYEDSQKNIWIGTQGTGLYLIQDNELFWYNTSNGLSDNTVNSMLEGIKNNYWIATNKGLSRMKLVKIVDDGESPGIKSYEFSNIQGLQALQFSPNCAIKAQTGKLIFGGINGLNVFRSNDIKENHLQPRVILEELRVENQINNIQCNGSPLTTRLNDTEHLRLKYTQRNFSISFSGINFINPDKNIYRYKIDGLDNNWVELGNQKIINFNFFPSGTYELELQVSTNPEYRGVASRLLTITVLPPWWKTWWAFIIYALIVHLLLVVFFILSLRWAKMKNQLSMQQFKSQKEKELHQLKLKFYTDVSHELRTPLTLILAPLEDIISKTELSYRFRNQLIQIQRSGYRLMQLVNQILDLRKLETGHERLEVAKGDVIRFISEICLAFREISQPKNIDFEFQPHKKELMLWYDRNKLEIIINNLLSNAFKFTQPGFKIKLLLGEVAGSEAEEAAGVDNEGYYLKISILNEGEGISSDHIEDIYKRFYSEKYNSTVNATGSGVGLELTRRMVELHRGGISVQSKDVDNGKKLTVFSVYLSFDKNVYTAEEINADFKNSEDSSLYKNDFIKNESFLIDEKYEAVKPHDKNKGVLGRLLVVEDNAEVRSFIKDFFAEEYDVIEAENGEKAFEKAIDSDPQLIISDVMMPVMDGIELCKKVKTDARTSHIPVILLTARTAVTFKYEGLETGADDYVTKPFSTKFLALRVKNLIEQRKHIHEYFKRQSICDPGTISLTSVDEKVLNKAVEYITDHIGDSSISVSKISEHVGMSRVHFYRKIKALTNQTAVEFIRDIRLKRAASMLEQNKLSIKEIQNMVGFEDPDYFRDCFKGKYGVTPSEYSSKHFKT